MMASPTLAMRAAAYIATAAIVLSLATAQDHHHDHGVGEDVRSKLQSKKPLSVQDLRTLDYSSILHMGEVAMDHPGLADLLVDRQDSLPVVRKVTGVAIKGGAASNTTVGFFARVGELKGLLSTDAKRAAAGVVAADDSERNPVFSIVAKKAPEMAIEMPVKFVAGLSAFDVKGYALSEEFRSLPNWTSVDASTRMNWYNALVKDLSGLEGFFSPNPADKKFLPLLIGAPLANLSVIEDQSQIEALLEIGESLSPVQLQLLSERFAWNKERLSHTRLRAKMRAFLPLELVNSDFEGDAEYLTEYSWPLLIKIAEVNKSLNPHGKFLAVTQTAIELEEYLHKHAVWGEDELNGIASNLLTRGQAGALLDAQLHAEVTDTRIARPLIVAVPAQWMMDLDLKFDESERSQFLSAAVERFDRMLPSQRLAAFLVMTGFHNSTERDGIVEEVSAFAANHTGLLGFVSPSEAAVVRVLSGTHPAHRTAEMILESLAGVRARASGLPVVWEMVLLENDGLRDYGSDNDEIKYEYFKNRNLSDLLTGLTCHQLERVNLLDILLVLSRYNRLMERQPWSVYPQAMRNCFGKKIAEFAALLSQEDKEAESEPFLKLDREMVRAIGGHVISAIDLEKLRPEARKEALSTVGAMSMPQIVVTMSPKTYSTLSNMANELMASREALTARVLFEVGSLSFYAPKIMTALKETESQVLRNFVRVALRGEHRLVCLPKQTREMWAELLLSVYGPTTTWTEETVYELGDLMVLIPKGDLSRIPSATMWRTVSFLLEESNLMRHYEGSRLTHTNSTMYCNACASWLGDHEGPIYHEAVRNLYRTYARAAELAVRMATKPDMEFSDPVSEAVRRRKRRQAADGDVAAAILGRPVGDGVDGGGDEDAVDGVGRQEEKGHSTEFYFNRTSEVLRTMHRENILSAELEKSVTEIIGGVKRQLAEFVQNKLNLTETPHHQKLGEHIDDLEGMPENAEAMRDIVDQMAAAGKEMALRVAAVIRLRPVDINVTKDEFCDFFEEICARPEFVAEESVIFKEKAVAARAGDGAHAHPQMPELFSCNGIRAAGKAAVVVRADDLEMWEPDKLWNCVETLGSIDWPLETKIEVWNLMETKLPQVAPKNGTIIPRYALLLNNLLEAVAVQNPASLNLTIFNVELLSSLGRFPFSSDLLELLAQQIKSEMPDGYELGSSAHPAEPYVMMFGSMGHLVCGFLDEDLTKVLFIRDTAQYLLPIFASQLARCESPAALQVMAAKAVEVYGSVASWRPSLIRGLGLIPAGLPPPAFARLTAEQVSALHPAAVAHLNASQVSGIAEADIGHLQPEAVEVLTVRHLQNLTSGQLSELKKLAAESATAHAHKLISFVEEMSKAEDMMNEVEGEPSEDGRSGPADLAVSSSATKNARIRRGDLIIITALLLMKLYFYVTLLVT